MEYWSFGAITFGLLIYIGGILSNTLSNLLVDYIKSESGKKAVSNTVRSIKNFNLLRPTFIGNYFGYQIFKVNFDNFDVVRKIMRRSTLMQVIVFSLVLYSTLFEFTGVLPSVFNNLISGNLALVGCLVGASLYFSSLAFASVMTFVRLHHKRQCVVHFMSKLREMQYIDNNDYYQFNRGIREVIATSNYQSFLKRFESFEETAFDLSEKSGIPFFETSNKEKNTVEEKYSRVTYLGPINKSDI